MLTRHTTELPVTPLSTPLSAEAFAEHLPVAVEAGGPLALVVLRVLGQARSRRRLETALRTAGGFAYELQPGAYALLMPGCSALDAFDAALNLRTGVRGGLLRGGAYVDAGVAALEDGMDARELFAAASCALDRAEALGQGAAIHTGAPAGGRVVPA
jgi:hypothetical protein